MVYSVVNSPHDKMTNKLCERILYNFNNLINALYLIFFCISTFAFSSFKTFHKTICFSLQKYMFNPRTSCRFAWWGTLLRGIDWDSTRATSGKNKYMKRHGIYSFQLKFNWSTRSRCQIPSKTYYTWVSECTSVCDWVYLGVCVRSLRNCVSRRRHVAAQRWSKANQNSSSLGAKCLPYIFDFFFFLFSLFVSLYLSSFTFHLSICVCMYFCIYHKAHLQNLWGLTRFFSSFSTDETEFLSQP